MPEAQPQGEGASIQKPAEVFPSLAMGSLSKSTNSTRQKASHYPQGLIQPLEGPGMQT